MFMLVCNFNFQILKEIEDHQINIYRFPPLSDDESENDLAALRVSHSCLMFSFIYLKFEF